MKKKSLASLNLCLLHAISKYDDDLLEEQGGFILKEVGVDNYEFVPVTNALTGTHAAKGLYIAETSEFNNKVAARTFDDTWTVFASYHTHPLGMRALPSNTDVSKLFTNFPVNFIYAPDRELNRFDYNPNYVKDGSDSKWIFTNVSNFNGFKGNNKIEKWIESENL